MANQNAKIGKITRSSYTPIINNLTIQQVRQSSTDIAEWRTAIDTAKNVFNPRRKLLYEMYERIEIDGHLLSVMEKRIKKITNKKIHFALKDNEGGIDDAVTAAILETPWFYDMNKFMLQSRAWGHSLIELIPEAGIITRAELVPRANVIPEKGMLAFNSANPNEGILYREDPAYANNLIEAGGKKTYGLMMSAAQYVIFKRGGIGDWAQCAELFGMPFREATYVPHDDYGRQKLTEAMENMGAAPWTVIPEGTSIKFHDNNGSGKAEIFKDLIEICNAEISKIFLGNTMTTDDGSSKSQADVHQVSENDIILSDMIEQEYLLNWTCKQKLIALGLPIPEGRFFYPDMQILPLDLRMKLDMDLSTKVEIADEYWYKTYGVPKPDGSAKPVNADPAKKKPEDAPAPVADPAKKPVKKTANDVKALLDGIKEINSIYTHAHNS